MDTRSKLLLIGLALVTAASVGVVVYRTVVLNDYPIDESNVEPLEEEGSDAVIDEGAMEAPLEGGEEPIMQPL